MLSFSLQQLLHLQLPSINKGSKRQYLFPPEGEYKDGTTSIKSVKWRRHSNVVGMFRTLLGLCVSRGRKARCSSFQNVGKFCNSK